jgi:pilus assembly protein Flp/PilA
VATRGGGRSCGEAGMSPAWTVGDRRAGAGAEEHMGKQIEKFLKDESGASLIEYVLIGGIISIVGVVTMGLIGGDIGTIWTNIHTGTTKGVTSSTAGVGG